MYIIVNLYCEHNCINITMETCIWMCSGGSLKKILTEREMGVLTVGSTFSRIGS